MSDELSRIRARMLGTSLLVLQRETGLSRPTLIDLRLGRRKPHPATIERVEAALRRLNAKLIRKGRTKKKRIAA